ncbi:L-tyrosine/L-tryptophan isonitrile synthase family protein [Nocardia salmonicida]|uniref:L-tyrosine/L-tryptophan isonitrile synthase family protein n=1 Tax=Nocardia salmonicida TaxID=53431 RepID=UPI00378DF474
MLSAVRIGSTGTENHGICRCTGGISSLKSGCCHVCGDRHFAQGSGIFTPISACPSVGRAGCHNGGSHRRSQRQSKNGYFVHHNESIHFVIPDFPAKSPNRSKVRGSTPDPGENIAPGFLQSLCDYVGYFYSPGARITICSDGDVFGDVVDVSEILVTEYLDEIEKWSQLRDGCRWTCSV